MQAESIATNYVVRRERRAGTSPIVSLVIASRASEHILESCISSLQNRFDPSHTEYVVAWSGGGHEPADLKRRFPHVQFISASNNTSAADLRMRGMKAAVGDVVLLLEQEQVEAERASSPMVLTSDGLVDRETSPKWADRLVLRASRESASVSSNA